MSKNMFKTLNVLKFKFQAKKMQTISSEVKPGSKTNFLVKVQIPLVQHSEYLK